MDRRTFLQQASLFTAGSVISLGVHGWALKGIAQNRKSPRLVVILLRGAVDGLSVVVPYSESVYYDARPTIAIPRPQEKLGVLDLDGRFGLHPALKDIMPLWQQKTLAFIPASGSPNSSRSHFDAQQYMENGTPGSKSTRDGWMNRLLAVLPQEGITQAINIGETTPVILAGKIPVSNIAPGRKATRALSIDQPEIDQAFAKLYSGSDPLSLAYQEGSQSRKTLLSQLQQEMKQANNGAPAAGRFDIEAQKLGRLMAGDPKIQLGFFAVGGWDTHVNQGNADGQLSRRLKELGQALATLTKALAPVYNQTVIVVMSEFGRTLAENGNRGSDHGHGNVMWLLGGGIRGGKIYGNWPGLEKSALFEGRDVAVTTDFRHVLSTVLENHMAISKASLGQIFPQYQPQKTLKIF